MRRRLMYVKRDVLAREVELTVEERPGPVARFLGRKTMIRRYQGFGLRWSNAETLRPVGVATSESLCRLYTAWVEFGVARRDT